MNITQEPEAFGYCWTNNKTGEFYYGVHKGRTDDSYIGSGKLFKSKFNKYKEHFYRTIKFVGSYDECLKWEAEVVDRKLLDNKLCLNLDIGGNFRYQSGNRNIQYNREPWENSNTRSKNHVLILWKLLDKVYDWWLVNGTKKYGGSDMAAASYFGYKRTKTWRYMLKWIKNHGDPRLNKSWIDFKVKRSYNE